MLNLVKKKIKNLLLYNFLFQNKKFSKIFQSLFNDFYNKFYKFEDFIDSRIIYNDINLTKPRADKKNYKNYFLIIDRNYKIKSLLDRDYEIIHSVTDIKSENIKDSLFFIFIQQEDVLVNEIDMIKNKGGYYKSVNFSKNNRINEFSLATSYRFTNSNCLKSIKETIKNKNRISHLSFHRLNTHENICEGLELTKNIDGDYVEIGVYKGGSALTALNYMKNTNQKRQSYLIDTFEGFNYEDAKNSSDIVWQNTHFISNDIETYVKETLKEYDNYNLIKSNIVKDNLPDEIKKISLANIDVDLEEATYSAIVKVSKKLSVYGIIMCEDPVLTPNLVGAKYALEKFLESEEGNNYLKIFKKNHYFLLKIK